MSGPRDAHAKAYVKYRNELAKKLTGEPVKNALRGFWSLVLPVVATNVKRKTPVDRGRLRSSIAWRVGEHWGSAGRTAATYGEVGTRVSYAPYMEFGTGLLSDAPQDDPDRTRARHWPPAAKLDLWAKRHKIKGGGRAVARMIGLRGGLRPRRFLRDGYTESLPFLQSSIGLLGMRIKTEWKK